MRKVVLLFLVLVLLCSCDKGVKEISSTLLYDQTSSYKEGVEIPDNQETWVKWEGRHEYQGSQMALYNTATGFTVDFEGTRLEATFNHDGSTIWYSVALDQESLPNPNRVFCLKQGETASSVTIVEGLKNARHKATVLKMSESADGFTAVSKITTDGSFIPRDASLDSSKLKFMFVCASGGSGYGSLAYAEDSEKSPRRTTANSSSLHAFTYLTARLFSADVQFVSQSGWTVSIPNKSIYQVLDQSGITTSNNVQGSMTTAEWDPNSYQADVIIFNIGGNDTTSSSFDRVLYQKECVEMVNKLHEDYPDAYMIWTHTNSNAGSYAISALNDAAILRQPWFKEVIIPKVGYLKVSTEVDNPWVSAGAGSHNSLPTHIATSEILAKALEEWGFVRTKENISFADQEVLLNR